MLMFLYEHLIIALGLILGVVFIAHVSTQRRSTSNAFAWLLLIVFVPYIGVPLYFIFGGRKLAGAIEAKRKIYEKQHFVLATDATETERILNYSFVPPHSINNEMAVLHSGEEAYQCIMEMIRSAKESIEVETFILGKDAVGQSILEALKVRAQEGIQVRFLLDGLFAFTYPKKHLKEFVAAGGKLCYFLPIRFRIFRSSINLRNHRKLFIVDGVDAIMGGMNLASDYMGPTPDKTRWCDIAMKVSGEAVYRARRLFYFDWAFASGETVDVAPKILPVYEEQAKLQLVASGPDVHGDPFYNALLTNIFQAKKQVTLVTPYFVPDEGLIKALGLAALRGVRVTIIVPRKSNHPWADFARSVHIRALMQVGVHVLFFEPTMLHAKVVTIDDALAIVGSANLDMRSLFLNFEGSLFCYGKVEVEKVMRWVKNITVYCNENHDIITRPTRMRVLMENIALLLAPLL